MLEGLVEINLYPYLNWVFYIFLTLYVLKYYKSNEKLFYFFIISLIFTTAFLIDVGFFIQPNHIMGIILILIAAKLGLRFPEKYTLILSLFFIISVISIFLNLDIVGMSMGQSTRTTFLRPAIQLTQLAILSLTMVSVIVFLTRYNNFKETMRFVHWLSIAVAVYAIYEMLSCYLHLPFLNLNNNLPKYWYMGFRLPDGIGHVFRPRSTFFEPIGLNNFQFFGISCSLIYKELYDINKLKYWFLFLIQFIVLILSFSRSVYLTVPVIGAILLFFYPYEWKKGKVFFSIRKIGNNLLLFILLLILFISFFKTPFFGEKNTYILKNIFYERMSGLSDELSIGGRAESIAEIIPLFNGEKWIFGIGIGNGPNWHGKLKTFTSIYNQILIYTGVAGLSIFLLFLSSILLSLFRNAIIRKNTTLNRRISLIYFCGLLGMVTQRLSFPGLLTDAYLWVAFGFGIYIERAYSFKKEKLLATPITKISTLNTHKIKTENA